MYKIKVSPRKTKFFTAEQDYLNYKDYMDNGLKVVRTEPRTTFFNDGSMLIDVSLEDATEKTYVLHKDAKTFKDMRYMQKYIDLSHQ